MKPRTFSALALTTAAMVVAATVAIGLRGGDPIPTVATGEKVFPELLDTTAGATKAVLVHPGGTLTFKRRDGIWGLAEKGGYPMRPGAIREVVLQLAGLEKLAAKTVLPKSHHRLELGKPGTEGARSRLFGLYDDNDKPIFEAVLGRRKFSLEGARGLYLRRADENQSWLAKGEVKLPVDAMQWVDLTFLSIPASMVKRAVIRHPDGETVVVTKAKAEDGHHTVEGSKVKSAEAADSLAAALFQLSFLDVAPVDSLPFAEGTTLSAEFTTFQGQTVSVLLDVMGDGKNWARFTVPGEQAAWMSNWAYKLPLDRVAAFRKRLADFR